MEKLDSEFYFNFMFDHELFVSETKINERIKDQLNEQFWVPFDNQLWDQLYWRLEDQLIRQLKKT